MLRLVGGSSSSSSSGQGGAGGLSCGTGGLDASGVSTTLDITRMESRPT